MTHAQDCTDEAIEVNITPDDVSICEGDSVDLTANATGGDTTTYSFMWNTGEPDDTTETIRVGDPGMYSVTVNDTCASTVLGTDAVEIEMYSGGDISCIGSQNVSVDENCEAQITPDMLVTGNYSCQDDFTVEVEDQNGNTIGEGDTVTIPGSYVGETLNATVFNQDASNQCWGEITLEDKMGPELTCNDTTVVCYRLDSLPPPAAMDNCSGVDTFLINEVIDNLSSASCDTVKRIERTYTAVDQNGATSTCTQTIDVTQIDESDITNPPDTTLFCNDGFDVNSNGNPMPSASGAPTIDGMNLNDPLIQWQCSFDVDYEDNPPIVTTGCRDTITRTWNILGSCFSYFYQQQIVIRDTSGPDISCPPLPDTLSTNMFQCTGTFFIPTADADDSCNPVKRVSLSVEGEWNAPPVPFMSDFDGGQIQLSAGPNVLTYTAYDECENSSQCRDTVYVLDQNEPVPICDQHTVASLNQQGEAKIFASTFDDGSLDDCMLDSFAVARMEGGTMPPDSSFGSFVTFDCEDQASNPNMVVFRVYDMAGNTNDCMVEVELQDKIGASIQCPPDITLSCMYPVDTSNLEEFGTIHTISSLEQLTDPQSDPREDVIIDDPELGTINPGQDGFAYDNCGIVTMDESVQIDSMNQCGELILTRTFTAMGPGGPVASCTQTITVEKTDSFFINDSDPNDPDDDVIWPEDTTIVGSCAPLDLDPAVLGEPIVDDTQCDLVGIKSSDWQFNFINGAGSNACYKVIRKWEIIDWCDFQDGEYTIYEFDQVIKVVDTTGPTFDSAPRDTSFCSSASCEMIPFSLSKTATDMCTPDEELSYEYFIDTTENATFNPDIEGTGTSFDRVFSTGDYQVRWVVEDRCGNRATQTESFSLTTCKQPTASCQNVNTSLTQMVVNGDTMIMAMVDVEQINANSSSFCGDSVTLTFDSTGAPKDTVLFSCEEASPPEQSVVLYVFDENGNSSECAANVEIQDPDSLCNGSGTGTSTGIVGGHIETDASQDMENVHISIDGAPMNDVITEQSGQYNFPPMAVGGSDYEVIPNYDKEPLNGVSTYDLVLIQKHILNIEKLVSPYKQIAADVNKTGQISAADLVDLRKLILGIDDGFQNNTSWRFVDKYYTFLTDNAASEDFPESYYIDELSGDMSNIDFTGVKIGDINGSVKMDGFSNVEERSNTTVTFAFADRSYKAGEDIEVPVYAETIDQLLGYQFTLDFDEKSLLYTGLKSGTLPVDKSHIGFPAGYEGLITMSWNDVKTVGVRADQPLFTLTFQAVQSGAVHDAFEMKSEVTRAEAYTGEGSFRSLALEFRGERDAIDEFALHQNIPNPFDRTTRIGFNLPTADEATLTVYDVTGKVIKQVSGSYNKGYNEITLNRYDLSAEGVMYYKLSTGDYTATKKMIMVE